MIQKHEVTIESRKIVFNLNRSMASGRPILFIHGLGSDAADYDLAFSCMKIEDRLLIAPDLIGFGQSEKPVMFSYDLLEQAKMLRDLLFQIGCRQVDVVAHSMGGVVAILLAKQYPEAVNRLIVAEPNLMPENAKISQRICEYGSEKVFIDHYQAFIGKYASSANASTRRFYQSLTETNAIAMYRTANSLLHYTRTSIYQDFLQLTIPRHYLKGERSWQIAPDWMLEDLDKHGIDYQIITHAGHGMMNDNPHDFYARIESIFN